MRHVGQRHSQREPSEEDGKRSVGLAFDDDPECQRCPPVPRLELRPPARLQKGGCGVEVEGVSGNDRNQPTSPLSTVLDFSVTPPVTSGLPPHITTPFSARSGVAKKVSMVIWGLSSEPVS